jgi:hypothetical protein
MLRTIDRSLEADIRFATARLAIELGYGTRLEPTTQELIYALAARAIFLRKLHYTMLLKRRFIKKKVVVPLSAQSFFYNKKLYQKN